MTIYTERFVEDYAEGYDFRFDGGQGYTPTDHERAMLIDFGHGLLSELPSTARVPADVSALVDQLRAFAAGCRGSMWQSRDETIRLCDEAASLIQSQAARIATLEAGLREIDRHNDSPIKYDSHLNSIVERLLNGERKG